MSKKDEALKLALEALEEVNYDQAYATEIAAIREALAEQPAQQEPSRRKGAHWTEDYPDSPVLDDFPIATQPAQQQEPVAWMVYTLDGNSVCVTDNPADFTPDHRALPLYTSPPAQRKPLTDEQLMAIGKELGLKCRFGGNPNIDFDYARAIEAAHGIKENT